MGILAKLDTEKFTNLPQILDEFEEKMKDYKIHLDMNGKKLETCNVENSTWLAYYDEIKIQLKSLVDFIEMKEAELRGKLTKLMVEKSSQNYDYNTRNRIIDGDKDINMLKIFGIAVRESYNQADAITKQFIQRGYALKNIVAIRVAALQDVTLFIDD